MEKRVKSSDQIISRLKSTNSALVNKNTELVIWREKYLSKFESLQSENLTQRYVDSYSEKEGSSDSSSEKSMD